MDQAEQALLEDAIALVDCLLEEVGCYDAATGSMLPPPPSANPAPPHTLVGPDGTSQGAALKEHASTATALAVRGSGMCAKDLPMGADIGVSCLSSPAMSRARVQSMLTVPASQQHQQQQQEGPGGEGAAAQPAAPATGGADTPAASGPAAAPTQYTSSTGPSFRNLAAFGSVALPACTSMRAPSAPSVGHVDAGLTQLTAPTAARNPAVSSSGAIGRRRSSFLPFGVSDEQDAKLKAAMDKARRLSDASELCLSWAPDLAQGGDLLGPHPPGGAPHGRRGSAYGALHPGSTPQLAGEANASGPNAQSRGTNAMHRLDTMAFGLPRGGLSAAQTALGQPPGLTLWAGNKSKAERARLAVRLLEARGLSRSSPDKVIDPFAVVSCEGASHSSKPVPKSTEPNWDEFFVFDVRQPAFAVLKLKVYDHMRCWRPAFLGHVRLPIKSIADFPARYAQPTWHQLRSRGGKPRGEVLMQLFYTAEWVHRPLRVLCGTWNVGNAEPPADLSPWLQGVEELQHDLVVLGVQECLYKVGGGGAEGTELYDEVSELRNGPSYFQLPTSPSGAIGGGRNRSVVMGFGAVGDLDDEAVASAASAAARFSASSSGYMRLETDGSVMLMGGRESQAYESGRWRRSESGARPRDSACDGGGGGAVDGEAAAAHGGGVAGILGMVGRTGSRKTADKGRRVRPLSRCEGPVPSPLGAGAAAWAHGDGRTTPPARRDSGVDSGTCTGTDADVDTPRTPRTPPKPQPSMGSRGPSREASVLSDAASGAARATGGPGPPSISLMRTVGGRVRHRSWMVVDDVEGGMADELDVVRRAATAQPVSGHQRHDSGAQLSNSQLAGLSHSQLSNAQLAASHAALGSLTHGHAPSSRVPSTAQLASIGEVALANASGTYTSGMPGLQLALARSGRLGGSGRMNYPLLTAAPAPSARQPAAAPATNASGDASAPGTPTARPGLRSAQSSRLTGAASKAYRSKAPVGTEFKTMWEDRLKEAVGPGYFMVSSMHMGQIRLVVFARNDIYAAISDVRASKQATGVAGVATNKGGVGISLRVWDTSLVFINSHLAAHQDRTRARNNNYRDIIRGLRLDPHDTMDALTAPHHVVWMGDLNYRLDYGQQAVTLAETPSPEDFAALCNDVRLQFWDKLLEMDQLKKEQEAQRCFLGFKEGNIEFEPSFKVRRQRGHEYNPQRSPAYCDRILYRSNLPLKQIRTVSYFSPADICSSDHKPVAAVLLVPTVWRNTVEEPGSGHAGQHALFPHTHLHLPHLHLPYGFGLGLGGHDARRDARPDNTLRLRLVLTQLWASGLFVLRSRRRASSAGTQFPSPQLLLSGPCMRDEVVRTRTMPTTRSPVWADEDLEHLGRLELDLKTAAMSEVAHFRIWLRVLDRGQKRGGAAAAGAGSGGTAGAGKGPVEGGSVLARGVLPLSDAVSMLLQDARGVVPFCVQLELHGLPAGKLEGRMRLEVEEPLKATPMPSLRRSFAGGSFGTSRRSQEGSGMRKSLSGTLGGTGAGLMATLKKVGSLARGTQAAHG